MLKNGFAATNPQAPASAHQLPDEAWVQLTQAVTWILTGSARTDEEIQEKRAIWAKTWGSDAGPGWLKPCLEHIRSAQDPLPAIETDGLLPLVPLAADGVPLLVAKARRWLERCGYDLDAADAQVRDEIERLASEDARRERLYKLTFSGRYELMGILHQPNPHRLHIPHLPIPATELRGVLYTMGQGYHGMGELGPAPATSTKVFFNATLFGTKAEDDRRPTYLCVIIKRTDVLALKVEFDTLEKQADRRPPERAGEEWPALGQSDHADGDDAGIAANGIATKLSVTVDASERSKLPRSMQHIFEAISEETKARGETRWLKMRPRHRWDAIWSQLHNLGYENEKKPKNQESFDRMCRKFFGKHLPSLLHKLEADIPDQNG